MIPILLLLMASLVYLQQVKLLAECMVQIVLAETHSQIYWFSVVVPVRNEAGNIGPLLAEIGRVLDLTESRISQLHTEAIQFLKKKLAKAI